MDWAPGSPAYHGGLLALAAGVLLVAGVPFTRAADVLAERTGVGRALVGGVLLGAMTSLPGLVTSALAAWEGRPSFAVSNALGGIAVQTAFIVVADLFHRHGNLEHAAASLPNLFQCLLTIGLLSVVVLGVASPAVTWGSVHPASIALVVVYMAGLRLTQQARVRPMWRPNLDPAAAAGAADRPPKGPAGSIGGTWLRFVLLGLTVATAGGLLARTGLGLAETTGLSDSFVGGMMTSVASSLPELMVAIFAVRAGALTLAVANIIGGNAFDILIVAVCDVLAPGSVYHAIDPSTFFVAAETLLLTATLAAGLLHRQRAGIGFEGVVILGVYLSGAAIVAFGF